MAVKALETVTAIIILMEYCILVEPTEVGTYEVGFFFQSTSIFLVMKPVVCSIVPWVDTHGEILHTPEVRISRKAGTM